MNTTLVIFYMGHSTELVQSQGWKGYFYYNNFFYAWKLYNIQGTHFQ